MNLTTDQLQRGVEAYQGWKANVGNEASSAFGGNLHELARRMYEAMAESARPEALRSGWTKCLQGDGSSFFPNPPCWIIYASSPGSDLLMKYWAGGMWHNSNQSVMLYYYIAEPPEWPAELVGTIPSPLAPIWPDPEDWNLICPKCGASPEGPCGWKVNCPTGLAKRSLPQGDADK